MKSINQSQPTPQAGEAVTTNYGWIKPTIGGSDDAWGGYINADLDSIDATVFGLLPKSGGTLTGALTPSSTAGIVGTQTNNNANAGSIGEVISANVTTPVALTNGTVATIATISLTPGDWDVSGEVLFQVGTGGATILQAAISSTATFPAAGIDGSRFILGAAAAASMTHVCPLRTCRASLVATTTYYLVENLFFVSGTCTATGNIWARRAR